MSAELFTEDIMNPVIFLLALIGIGYICMGDVLRWYQAQRKEMQQRQEQHAGEEKPVQQIPPAQRMYPCPYCDVHEQANWIAYEAWQRWQKRSKQK